MRGHREPACPASAGGRGLIMGYIAQRRLTWGDGHIEAGEPVPEYTGRNYDQMVEYGDITGFPDPPRVIVPFTSLHADCAWALENQPFTVEYVDVSGSDTAYFDLLEGLWEAHADFVIVEQDVAVFPTTLRSFVQCKGDWCQAPYQYLGSPVYPGLGCARFRSRLLHSEHELMAAVAKHDYPNHGPRHWCTLDASMQRELWATGRQACIHEPVRHCSDGRPSHGCC